MDSGFYAAVSGWVTQAEALDVTANNISNVSTTAYKASREFFSSLTASMRSASRLSPLNRVVNDYGILGGTTLDFQPGMLQPTGNDLDVALEGAGFLTVQTKAGIRYTRNGHLHLDPAGQLVTEQNDFVLGVNGPIKFELKGNISISPDGTISQGGTFSQLGAIVDRLRLANFPPDVHVANEGNEYYTAPKDKEQPAEDPRVRQRNLEASNFNAISGIVSLVEMQRHAEILRRAVSMFDTDFAAPAAGELPQVQG